MTKKLYTEFILLFSLGALTSLSLPPFNYLIINFITFSFFFIFLIKKSHNTKNKKLFFIYGWLFGFGYFITNLYWISISLTFDESLKFLVPISLILIPAFLSLFYGFISFLFFIFKPKKIIIFFLLFSIIYSICEYIRGFIFTGFPWNLIAYSFSNHLEILSITSIIGTYGFNLFCISLFITPAMFLLRDSKKDIFICILYFFATICFYFYGTYSAQQFNKVKINKHDYKIRLVASNIALDRFYYNIDPITAIDDLIEISNPKPNEKTVFVWPEGILPGIFQDQLFKFHRIFQNHFNENHFLIIGINSKIFEEGLEKYFNSISIYDHNLNFLDKYNKINLVPFGEFLPLEKIFKKVGLKTLTNNYQSYSKGDKRNIIKINHNDFSLRLLPLICYEIIYSGRIFTHTNFDFIINISEDGWFGQSVGPKQHFIHSIFRSIESGKYILRSANNGIAAIINPLGDIEQKIDFGKSGYIDFNESRKIQPTIFSQHGNKIFVILILMYIFLIFSFNRNKNE